MRRKINGNKNPAVSGVSESPVMVDRLALGKGGAGGT